MDVYQIVDLVLELLFSETKFQSEWSQIAVDVDDPLKGATKEKLSPEATKWKTTGSETAPTTRTDLQDREIKMIP